MANLYGVQTKLSSTFPEARLKVILLYKHCLKAIPQAQSDYELQFTNEEMKKRIRFDFDKHGVVKQKEVLDMLRWKGQMDLNETTRIWKQSPHLVNYFSEKIDSQDGKKVLSNDEIDQEFLDKFFNGIRQNNPISI
eukprot:TRINITY_DN67850_c0_g1_i1.p1 TRINITY_DN67850_c0_g1~~TRINITY_DN67850_c0_g1_i1.p1  ORF type:complete len:145 (-),score=29.76 TRINITY_DN67850_c0_g1_i1:45-452(-)